MQPTITEEPQVTEPLDDREETVVSESGSDPSPVPEKSLLTVSPNPSIRRNSAPDKRLKIEVEDSPRRHSTEKTHKEQKREKIKKNEMEKKNTVTRPRLAIVPKTKEPLKKLGEWGFHNERICQICAVQKIRQRDTAHATITVFPLPDMTF